MDPQTMELTWSLSVADDCDSLSGPVVSERHARFVTEKCKWFKYLQNQLVEIVVHVLTNDETKPSWRMASEQTRQKWFWWFRKEVRSLATIRSFDQSDDYSLIAVWSVKQQLNTNRKQFPRV